MSNIDLPVLRKHAIDGNKRFRRIVPLVAAAALSAALVAAAAGPASAAVQKPARTAPISLASSDNSARDGVVIDAAKPVQASAQNTTITVLPGITLSITSTGIRLSMTKDAVTEVENVVGFGQNVASLVGAILGVAQVPALGSQITGIVAGSLGLGNGLLKLCTASDGHAIFTIPWPWLWLSHDLPSCSGISL